MARTAAAPRSGPGLLWLPMLVCALFLYLPILVLVVMSFNGGGPAYDWGGFSFRWYDELAHDGELIGAVVTSLGIATGATVVATVLGTLLAVGLARHARSRLLVFTLSLDEFVIAYFTAGPTTRTLPITVYAMVRTGITPEINALATVLVLISVVVVVVAARAVRTKETS